MIHQIIKYVGIIASAILVVFIITDIVTYPEGKRLVADNQYTSAMVGYSWLSIMGYIASLHIKLKNKT